MAGETDLGKLLLGMQPQLHAGEYVFCALPSGRSPTDLNIIGWFREDEAVTVILPKEQADAQGLPYSFVAAWITLTVHSALDAVGLTAAVSRALTDANISCNVVAAFYHDHLFVPIKDAGRALTALRSLSESGT